MLSVCHHFSIPTLVCINKYDLNRDNTLQIEGYCLDLEVEVVAKIPFDNVVTEALAQGLPVVEYSRGKVTQEIESLWQRVNPTTNKKSDAVAVIRNGRRVALLPEVDRLRQALNLPLKEVKHIVDDFTGIMNWEPTSDEREFWKAILDFKRSQK